MAFVYGLFDRTIVKEPEGRISDAGELLSALDETTRLIELNARLPIRTAGKICQFCGVGVYAASSYEDIFGQSVVAGTQWITLLCDHCGHVHLFRPDKTKRGKMSNLLTLP